MNAASKSIFDITVALLSHKTHKNACLYINIVFVRLYVSLLGLQIDQRACWSNCPTDQWTTTYLWFSINIGRVVGPFLAGMACLEVKGTVYLITTQEHANETINIKSLHATLKLSIRWRTETTIRPVRCTEGHKSVNKLMISHELIILCINAISCCTILMISRRPPTLIVCEERERERDSGILVNLISQRWSHQCTAHTTQ